MSTSTRPVGRPSGVNGDETRAQILTQARTLFAGHGYPATSIRMIADAVGIQPAALHHHFGRKHELLAAVAEATERPVYERMRAAVERAGTFTDKVAAVLTVSHEVLRSEPDMAAFAAALRTDVRRHPEIADVGLRHEFTELFGDIVRSGVESGAVAARDATAVQGLITAMSQGLAFLATEIRPDVHEGIVEACVRLLRGRLLQPPDTAEGHG